MKRELIQGMVLALCLASGSFAEDLSPHAVLAMTPPYSPPELIQQIKEALNKQLKGDESKADAFMKSCIDKSELSNVYESHKACGRAFETSEAVAQQPFKALLVQYNKDVEPAILDYVMKEELGSSKAVPENFEALNRSIAQQRDVLYERAWHLIQKEYVVPLALRSKAILSEDIKSNKEKMAYQREKSARQEALFDISKMLLSPQQQQVVPPPLPVYYHCSNMNAGAGEVSTHCMRQ